MNEPTRFRMLDYIREEPDALARSLDANAARAEGIADRLGGLSILNVIVTGFGSSYTAALIAAPLLRRYIPVPLTIVPPTAIVTLPERYLTRGTLVVAVSRSGERGWLMKGLESVKPRGAYLVAVTASESSLLAQAADARLITREGPEEAFPKTKSVVAAAGCLAQLAIAFARDGEASNRGRDLLARLPHLIRQSVSVNETLVDMLAARLGAASRLLIAGTNGNYGVALEGQIKVQEASMVTTLAEETGQLLHGALVAVDASWAAVALATPGDQALALELLGLLKQLGATRVALTSVADVATAADYALTVPDTGDDAYAGFVALPPIHLLAYHLAVQRGLNPDQPRGFEAVLSAILPPGRQEPD